MLAGRDRGGVDITMANTPNEDLRALLAKVKRPGDYYATGFHETPLPVLSVDGVGQISFPIPDAQIAEIVGCAEQAPYGLGDQTLLDEEVRRTWQLGPDQFSVSGAAWERTLANIAQAAKKGLGVGGAVSAQLYKMLVYEVGDFFAEHRDSEKADGMFGTLVVALPTLGFCGGELRICHAGRQAVVHLHSDDPGRLGWAAFYADCEHEVWPVVEGHRVILVYNLVQKSGKKRPATPDTRPKVEAVARFLHGWGPTWPPKMLYLLEHKYTRDGLSMRALKGRDAAVAGVLVEAAEAADCVLHLAMVSIEEGGAADYLGYPGRSRYGRRRYRQYDDIDDDDDENNYEIVEVFDRTCTVTGWRTVEDEPARMGPLPFDAVELVPEDGLKDVAPDAQSFWEATGNEGGSFERTYLNAALVIWPQRLTMAVLAAGPRAGVVAYLGRLLAQPADGADARTLAGALVDRWSAGRGASPEMLAHLVALGDAELLGRFVVLLSGEGFGAGMAPDLVAAAGVVGWDAAMWLGPLCATGDSCFGGWTQVLALLAGRPEPGARALGLTLLGALLEVLPRDDAPLPSRWLVRNQVPPEALVGLLTALGGAAPAQIDAAVSHLLEHSRRFPMRATLVPACATSSALPPTLRAACVRFLQEEISVDITPPDHWRQDVLLDCRCGDCAALQSFILADARVGRFPLAKQRRQHLHRQIDAKMCDMAHVTERKGSPFTLVCTKNRASYEKKAQGRAEDEAYLAALTRG